MRDILGTWIGKMAKAVLAFRRGGGQALPGLIVERLFPGYVGSMLAKLPGGVVIITGTNGKTTTTKIVVSLLEANGKRVLTNPTGSNLVRGIASSISQHAGLSANLPYDVAVLEIDEATARRFVRRVAPSWVLGLNVSRDQLDRFGEVDTVASYVGAAMQKATAGVIANAGDPHLVEIVGQLPKNTPVYYFGVADDLKTAFPTDYELAAVDAAASKATAEPKADVLLSEYAAQQVTYRVDRRDHKVKLKLTGQHNFLNAAAAIALVRRLLPQADPADLVEGLSRVSLAFGRGEIYKLPNGRTVELVLVKNPASFTQALASYSGGDAELMIAINDNIADGRDVSWLWDVNFTPLVGRAVRLASGSRAADMALRLRYDDIATQLIEQDLSKALQTLVAAPGKKVILATYTAMLGLYGILSKEVERLP